MYKYIVYGIVIDSEIEFMQLVRSDGEAQAEIRNGSIAEYIEKRRTEEKPLYDIGLEESWFVNSKGYYLIRSGKEIIFECKEGVKPEMLRNYILGFAMSMLLLQRRRLAIHCSAICDEDGAVLISGDIGAGKSTIASALIESGYRMMADDVAAVTEVDGKVVVMPGFPYQKLCRNEVEKKNLDMEKLIYIDEDKDKFLVPVSDKFEFEPKNLNCMIYLCKSETEEVRVTKLSGLNQLMTLRYNLFLHKLTGEWENKPEVVNLCLALASKFPIYVIERPDEKDSRQEIKDTIIGIIGLSYG